jgi:hypothetical protein
MMLFHLRLKNIGVKIFERTVLLKNARYSRGPSLKNVEGCAPPAPRGRHIPAAVTFIQMLDGNRMVSL